MAHNLNSTVVTTTAANSLYSTNNNIYSYNGVLNWSAGNSAQTTSINLQGRDPKIIIPQGEIDLILLLRMMEQLQSILCVIREDPELQERYPALKSIYEQYQVMATLARAEDSDAGD